MQKRMLFGIVAVGILLGQSVWASGYKITCDDGLNFEDPLVIQIRGSHASAGADTDGPGGAIFDYEYKHLNVSHLKKDSDGNLEEADIKLPRNSRGAFSAFVQRKSNGEYEADASMVSTDEDKMPFDGKLDCEVKPSN